MNCMIPGELERYLDHGTWGRQARRVVLLAAEAGLTLDCETLILRDVRELATLQWRLEQRLAGRSPRRRSGLARLTRGHSRGHVGAARRMMKGDTITMR